LRCFCQIKDEIKDYASYQSIKSADNEIDEEKLDNLKILIQSADPAVRERAEFELQQLIDDIKSVRQYDLLTKFSKEYVKFQENKMNHPKIEVAKSVKSEPVDSDDSSEHHTVIGANLGPIVPVPESIMGSDAGMPDDEVESYHSVHSQFTVV
jgi:hypothetical protein